MFACTILASSFRTEVRRWLRGYKLAIKRCKLAKNAESFWKLVYEENANWINFVRNYKENRFTPPIRAKIRKFNFDWILSKKRKINLIWQSYKSWSGNTYIFVFYTLSLSYTIRALSNAYSRFFRIFLRFLISLEELIHRRIQTIFEICRLHDLWQDT